MQSVYLLLALLVIPAVVSGQTIVREDQTLTATWDISAQCDALNICNQPAGTAGLRILVDGTPVASVAVPLTLPVTLDVPLQAVGTYTIRAEAYNCRSGCTAMERRTLWPASSFEVIAADPPPPGVGPAPVLTVSP